MDFMIGGMIYAAENVNKEEALTVLSKLQEWIIAKAEKLAVAIVIAVIGWYIVKFFVRGVKKSLERSKLDASISGFLLSMVNYALKIILFIIVITTLGVEMTSIVAVVGSAGLAIGLALQGCLSNFVGGVLILITKPFVVGDYIMDSNGNEGTVTAIDIIYTSLLTPDNKAVTIPNGGLANNIVTNTTKEKIRRIDFNVSIDYNEDLLKVKEILYNLGKESPYILQDKELNVFVNTFDPSGITMTLRLWVKSEQYWEAKWKFQEDIKLTFDANHIVIPYDKLDVNICPGKPE